MTDFLGKITDVSKDIFNGKAKITFEVDLSDEELKDVIEKLRDKDLLVNATENVGVRTIRSNRYYWAIISDIAKFLGTSIEEANLLILEKYGQYTYVNVLPEAEEALKQEWKDCKKIGTITIDGKEYSEMLCYFGTHTYDQKSFNALIDGALSELNELTQ